MPQEQAIDCGRAATELGMSWSIDAMDPGRIIVVLELPGETELADDSVILDDTAVARLKDALLVYISCDVEGADDDVVMRTLAQAIRHTIDPLTQLPPLTAADLGLDSTDDTDMPE